jgi:hypothetical protein
MKRVLIFVVALALVSFAVPVFAQTHNTQNNPQYDTPGERNLPDKVDIVGSPQVNTSSNAAEIRWQTNNVAATDVWLQGGGINGHRTQYERGGSRDHVVSFNNLRPNTTYTFLIKDNDGRTRATGSFTTR